MKHTNNTNSTLIYDRYSRYDRYDQTDLENDLKKYFAIKPYDDFTNPVAYDGHYLNSLCDKYGEEIVRAGIESMKGACDRVVK